MKRGAHLLAWEPSPLATRVFPYDVFLSHNRDDGSASLAQGLIAAGVAVWYDETIDLRDRRVRDKVWKGLRGSRYIVVCISSTFHDSKWVRAEYEPGLQFEAKHGISRVLVAVTGNAPNIPPTML
jgi:TIR domain